MIRELPRHGVTRGHFLRFVSGAASAAAEVSLLACDFGSNPFGPTTPPPTPPTNTISRVELTAGLPQPCVLRNWRERARHYDEYAFNFDLPGELLLLPWWDHTHVNIPLDTFGVPCYVGDTSQQPSTNNHTSINTIAAVLYAMLVSGNKSNQNGQNRVAMLVKYPRSTPWQQPISASKARRTSAATSARRLLTSVSCNSIAARPTIIMPRPTRPISTTTPTPSHGRSRRDRATWRKTYTTQLASSLWRKTRAATLSSLVRLIATA